jgi:hypothetical protein
MPVSKKRKKHGRTVAPQRQSFPLFGNPDSTYRIGGHSAGWPCIDGPNCRHVIEDLDDDEDLDDERHMASDQGAVS